MPKISELNTISNTSTSDLMVIVKDVNGAPSTSKITVGNFMTHASRMGAYATTTEPGVIKVGNNLTINATGFLNASSSTGTGNIVFVDTTITTTGNGSITIDPAGTGELILKGVVFENFDDVSAAIIYRDANTVGNYGGVGNSSIYLDIATILNENGDYVIKGDGRFRYFTNDEVAIQNTEFGHIILRSENNDKFIKVHNVTDNDVGIEIRTDDHSIQLAPNNYIWDFSPQGALILPLGGTITESGGIFNKAIKLTPADGANANQALLIYPTIAEGNHIHLKSGGSSTELYLGDDYQYVKLANNGGIVINATDYISDMSQWSFSPDKILTLPVDGDIYRNGISVLPPVMLAPNVAYTGVFNGYPATIPVIKGQGIVFTSNNYVLETSNKYWWDGEFDTDNYDLSGVETLDFYNLGGIKLDFRLGGKSETLLTDVNLRDIVAILDDFYITQLPALETFSANNLSYVRTSFQITGMDNANTQFNFPNLKTVEGTFYYVNNDILENTPQFPELENVKSFQIYYNSAVQNTMTFDSLTYIDNMQFYENTGFSAAPEFPALTALGYTSIYNNNFIDPPTFPDLETTNSSFYFYDNSDVTTAPALPSLVTADYIQISGNPSMANGYNFSSLVTVNSSMNFDNNTVLTVSPTFPLLQTLDGSFTMDNNPLLTSGLSFPSLKTLNGNFSVNGCGFNETTINNLLVKLASLNGTGGTTLYENRLIYVNGGTNAIPTGAGLAAITTLEGRGCTVYKNT